MGCRMRIMGRMRCYDADSVLSVTRFASSAPARSFLPSVSLSAEATRRRERSVEFSSMASAPPHSHRLLKKPPLVLVSSLGRELEGVVPISARQKIVKFTTTAMKKARVASIPQRCLSHSPFAPLLDAHDLNDGIGADSCPCAFHIRKIVCGYCRFCRS